MKSGRLSKLSVTMLMVYLSIVALEGVVRWTLGLVKLEAALYLRDLIPVAGIALSFVSYGEIRRSKLFLIFAAQLAVGAVAGAFLTHNAVQALVGLKAFVPLAYGIAVYPSVMRHWDYFARLCFYLLGAVIVGMVLNAFVSFPWIGAEFTAFDVKMELSREWAEIDGRDRLPGFSRASYDAAAQMLPLFLCGVGFLRRSWLKVALAAATIYAIYLTTSKVALACIAVLLPNYFIFEFLSWRERRSGGAGLAALRQGALWLLRLQIAGFAIAMVLMPTLTGKTLSIVERNLREDSEFHLLSFEDRAANFWPMTWEYIEQHGNAVFGSGVGSVGFAQDLLGSSDITITADNCFLYLYAVFGSATYIYFALLVWVTFSPRLLGSPPAPIFALLALSATIQGISKNTIEGPYDCIFLGLFLAHFAFGTRQAKIAPAPVTRREPSLEPAVAVGASGSAA